MYEERKRASSTTSREPRRLSMPETGGPKWMLTCFHEDVEILVSIEREKFLRAVRVNKVVV